MNIIERIKNFFRNKDTKALPEGQVAQAQYVSTDTKLPNSHILQRADGSTLEIAPELDEMGNQTYEQVYNRRTQAMQAIPKFRIKSDELMRGGILSKVILMDIDPQLLNNPYCADFIANDMLSAKRTGKVMNEYGDYAGTIRTDEYGRLCKIMDEGIKNTLNDTRAENARIVAADRIVADKALADKNRENAQNLDVNIKTSHAQRLDGETFER